MLSYEQQTAATSNGVFICTNGTQTNAVVYTVPTGKTFYGRVICASGTYDQCLINGSYLYRSGSNGYEFNDLVLPGGTIVSTGPYSYNFTIIGFER